MACIGLRLGVVDKVWERLAWFTVNSLCLKYANVIRWYDEARGIAIARRAVKVTTLEPDRLPPNALTFNG